MSEPNPRDLTMYEHMLGKPSVDSPPAVSAEPLYQYKLTQRECSLASWALMHRAGVTQVDEVREAMLALAARFREAIDSRRQEKRT